MEQSILMISLVTFFIGVALIAFTFKKRHSIITEAKKKAEQILHDHERRAIRLEINAETTAKSVLFHADKKASEIVTSAEEQLQSALERIERLNVADKEITSRLKQSRAIIDDITDKSCAHAADIEIVTVAELLSSQTYQEDRKVTKAKLKKLAVNAIDGVNGSNSNVNIGTFIAISAKADMAGTLLLTTIEMLCSKVNANNGHQALEKLAETIIATEALIKCIDSRASLNEEFRTLLTKRLEIEIHYKKAKQIAKEEQRELKEQEREEKKARDEAKRIQDEAEREEKIKSDAIAELEMRNNMKKIGQ